jgi:hypothetical protein
MARKPKSVQPGIETTLYEVIHQFDGTLNNEKLFFPVGDKLRLNKADAFLLRYFIKEFDNDN